MIRHRLGFAVIVLLAVVLMTAPFGCRRGTPSTGNASTVKIVSSLPRTGSAKAQTDTVVNAIKLALDEAEYKVGNFTIEYLDWDDAAAASGSWTAELESANADRAVKDADVMVYIGPFNSGAAKNSMPILNRASVLMISPANTWPGLTKKGAWEPGEPEIYRPTGKKNYTRVAPTDDLQGPRGAEWAAQMGLKSVYVLHDNDLYGKGIADLFKSTCEDLGIKVLGSDGIDTKSSEGFGALMVKVKAANPELVYFGGTTQTKGGQLARDLSSSGLKCPLMVPDGCMEEAFIEAAGADNINGRCYVTFGGVPIAKLEGGGKQFVDKYRGKYKSDPQAYAIYGYEAAKVALEAIRKAGKKDRAATVDAAFALRDFAGGALGTWSFDENGDTTLTKMSGNIVRDGKFEFVQFLGK